MAAKVFFLFVAVLVLFEAEAAFYRREFFDPGSPFMRDRMEYDDPISRRREMPGQEGCRDTSASYCVSFAHMGYCNNPRLFANLNNFRTFTEDLCKMTCHRC